MHQDAHDKCQNSKLSSLDNLISLLLRDHQLPLFCPSWTFKMNFDHMSKFENFYLTQWLWVFQLWDFKVWKLFTWHIAFIKVIRIATIKVRMFDGVVRILTNVEYIPKLRRSLISLGVVDTLGYDFSIKKKWYYEYQ